MIAAVTDNGVIGRDNALPWHLPADLQRFKALTLGKPVLMGRNTHQSIGRALPGRRNLVLTRGNPTVAEDVEVVHSIEAALLQVAGAPELMVIGGAQLYRALLPGAQRIYLTRVHTRLEGDAFFPELDPAQWRVTEALQVPADRRNAFDMTFTTLERAGAAAAD